jgi:GMP synthase (glutamine-hydrolysing)
MILQHVGHEPLGTLDPMLKAAGFRIRYVNFARHPDAEPAIEGYNGLIVLGGPMGVYQADLHPHLKFEMRLIEAAILQNIPVLGICLGAQLIASVLGAHVEKAREKELGWYSIRQTPAAAKDPLFSSYGTTEKIFEMHQDTYKIPTTAVHLSASDLCPGQAFRYGDRVYGLQFHLEADVAMILRWLNRREYKEWIEGSHGALLAQTIESDTKTHIERSLELSQHTFGKFIDIFALPERPILLGSDHGKPRK